MLPVVYRNIQSMMLFIEVVWVRFWGWLSKWYCSQSIFWAGVFPGFFWWFILAILCEHIHIYSLYHPFAYAWMFDFQILAVVSPVSARSGFRGLAGFFEEVFWGQYILVMLFYGETDNWRILLLRIIVFYYFKKSSWQNWDILYFWIV